MARGSDRGATIKSITHSGRTVDLNVDSRGTFYALVADQRIEAKSLDGLRDKVKRAIDLLGKIRIPITLMETRYDYEKPEFEDGFLVGYQSHRRVSLVEDLEGRVSTEHHYSKTLMQRLSKVQKERIIAAWRAQKAAETHYTKLLEDAQIDSVPQLLEEAAKAVDAAAPAPKEEGADDAV